MAEGFSFTILPGTLPPPPRAQVRGCAHRCGGWGVEDGGAA